MMGRLVIMMFSDGMFSDGTFSNGTFCIVIGFTNSSVVLGPS